MFHPESTIGTTPSADTSSEDGGNVGEHADVIRGQTPFTARSPVSRAERTRPAPDGTGGPHENVVDPRRWAQCCEANGLAPFQVKPSEEGWAQLASNQ
jgi:hypothetical protein